MSENDETKLAVFMVQTDERLKSLEKSAADIPRIKEDIIIVKTRIAGWGAAAAIVGPIIFALITQYITFKAK